MFHLLLLLVAGVYWSPMDEFQDHFHQSVNPVYSSWQEVVYPQL